MIISPYFPPSNTPDMQRVRTSLPYFQEFGWNADVVVVHEDYSEMSKDELLLQSIPAGTIVYKVAALSRKWTAKFGLGSIALRSMFFYKKMVDKLLKDNHYDLIYFSSTQFPVCVMCVWWKKKFQIPYVIDMQDPWHSDYYQDKPRDQWPPKYWFSYRMNKFLEQVTLKHSNGLIAVSQKYIDDLKARYPIIKSIPESVITFGAFAPDIEIAVANRDSFPKLLIEGFINIVYIGRGGMDMHKAVEPVFKALQAGLLSQPELFGKFRFHFIGTSYAAKGKGVPTIYPLAESMGLQELVSESTDRISYYHALVTLKDADALFLPGSDDPAYTPSKIYPYLLTQKAMLAVFNTRSPATEVLRNSADGTEIVIFDKADAVSRISRILTKWANKEFKPIHLRPGFENFSAKNLTGKQVDLFMKVLEHFEKTDTNA